MNKMKTTICAYCDHEVIITPDGVCLFCGGNLAEEPINDPQKWETIKENIAISKTSRKSRFERIQDIIEPDPERLKKIRAFLIGELRFEELEIEKQKQKESQLKKEMKELDTYTKIVGESKTFKNAVKSLDKSLIPFWLKFGAFLFGLVLSAFYSFPSIQEPLLETINLINSSSLSIMVLPIILFVFLLVLLKKFDREMF